MNNIVTIADIEKEYLLHSYIGKYFKENYPNGVVLSNLINDIDNKKKNWNDLIFKHFKLTGEYKKYYQFDSRKSQLRGIYTVKNGTIINEQEF